jgi:Uma2 family endonuclease
MVAERRPARMTVEEWRVLERVSPEIKHEYIDGQLSAMAGGTSTHARIALNAAILLDALLADGACMVYTFDLAARLSDSRYTYPDVVVSCETRDAPSRERTEVEAPRVVFEVLSEGTERYDRGRKWAYYRECESLREYVLVSTEYRAVEVYRRTDGEWNSFHAYGPGDEVELTSIDVRFSVAALYRRTDVPESPAPL